MIVLEDGLERCGRCISGDKVGFILDVGRRTYTIRWRDGDTTQIRPDVEDEDEIEFQQQAAE